MLEPPFEKLDQYPAKLKYVYLIQKYSVLLSKGPPNPLRAYQIIHAVGVHVEQWPKRNGQFRVVFLFWTAGEKIRKQQIHFFDVRMKFPKKIIFSAVYCNEKCTFRSFSRIISDWPMLLRQVCGQARKKGLKYTLSAILFLHFLDSKSAQKGKSRLKVRLDSSHRSKASEQHEASPRTI